MNRIRPIVPDAVTGRAWELLEAVKTKLGVIPNMMRAMANSPAVLDAYLSLSSALNRGSLSGRTREAIALAIGQANGCQYCVSAHTLLGKKAGLSEADVTAARTGESSDPKTAAALRLALIVNNKQGHVSDAELAAARSAGLSDGEIGEVVAVVSLNIFTNYFNHVADPEIDFPVVKL
jgi:uncharacterized peroxidase-related enzyme